MQICTRQASERAINLDWTLMTRSLKRPLRRRRTFFQVQCLSETPSFLLICHCLELFIRLAYLDWPI